MGKMRNQMLTLREDFGRIKRALVNLDRVEEWQMSGFFDELENRMGKGIPSFLADLCEIPGMTKGRAAYLYNQGIIDRQGIRESASSLEGEVDDDFMKILREVASGIR
jgi:hypothetical protein